MNSMELFPVDSDSDDEDPPPTLDMHFDAPHLIKAYKELLRILDTIKNEKKKRIMRKIVKRFHTQVKIENCYRTKKKRKFQMYDLSGSVMKGWSLVERREFHRALLTMTRHIRELEYSDEITELANSSDPDKEVKISALQSNIVDLKTKTLKDIALPIDEDYNWEAVSRILSNKHTPEECQSIWKIHLHPHINKNVWTKDEHEALKTIKQTMKDADWDEIAKQLNTGRTGYQCSIYFHNYALYD